MHAVRAAFQSSFAHDGAAVEIGAGGDDGGTDSINSAGAGDYGGHGAIFGADINDFGLFQAQPFLLLQSVLHHFLVAAAVRLCTQGVDSRAFAAVQQPVLDAGFVGCAGHFTAQGVQFAHQMAFAGAADGGVAGHIAHRVQINGKTDHTTAHPSCRQSGLNAGVSRADNGNIKGSGQKLLHITFLSVCNGDMKCGEKGKEGISLLQALVRRTIMGRSGRLNKRKRGIGTVLLPSPRETQQVKSPIV